MDKDGMLAFARGSKYWVQASTTKDGSPQAAVIGVAVSDRFELVFDTLGTTRKAKNLRDNPRIALAMWDGERTLQVDGVADEPGGDELARVKRVYFAAFADGPEREAWEGITYFRVRPTWIRYTDFGGAAPAVAEISGDALG